MRRWINRFIFAIALLPLVCEVGVILRDRTTDDGTSQTCLLTATPDAAVALRLLTHSKAPDEWWIRNPGSSIVGHCSKPCLSEAEARQCAYDDAARIFKAELLHRLGGSRGEQKWISAELTSGSFYSGLGGYDAIEKFDRPYGTVWTDTFLVGSSPDSLIIPCRIKLQAHKYQTTHLQYAAVAISLLAWFIYLLLNTITKGYFTLRLRLFAGTITTVALLVILGGQ